MLRTQYASELNAGNHVKVCGWVNEKRDLGKIIFIILRDLTGYMQITAKKESTPDDLFDKLKQLKRETVVCFEGRTVENKNAPNGLEIVPTNVSILAESELLPIDMSEQKDKNGVLRSVIQSSLDKRLDFRCVDLRRPECQSVFKVQSTIIQEMQSFLQKNKFMQVFTPCLMGVASESGAEVFSVVYYDKEAFLRQDPQLHRQLTIAGGFERIYDVGPSWRAEQSHTVRHLCEHRTCAVEMAFIEDEYDVIRLEQDLVIYVMNQLKKDCKKELDFFGIELEVPKEFPVINFPEVYDILEEMGETVKRGKEDYNTEQEKMLGDYVKKKYDSDFFFVNRFPFAKKPFYVMKYDDTYARSIDLIYKGVELSSGGQREHRYDLIMKQAKEKGMNPESVRWFADFFKYGVPPHGGFAIGLERITKQLLNLQNIREAVLFPRDVERIVP